MARRRPELAEKLKELKEQVAAAEGDASSLKVWAMQELGVQASSRVIAAADPLKTLRDICQNFPFMARTLSKLPVNRNLQQEVQQLQCSMFGPGFSGLFLNGLPLPIADNVSAVQPWAMRATAVAQRAAPRQRRHASGATRCPALAD
jgi:hypothetical protein